VTAGPTEAQLLDRIRQGLGKESASQVIFYGGEGVGELSELAGVLSHASLAVAPSTGPLHIAVALGVPVLTFYPPIRVQSALRWGPYVRDDRRAAILVPEVYCGQDFQCRGTLCHYFPCMKTLTVPQALEEAERLLSLSKENRSS
jgi:ADP-heptose:LPS heptosyltransferase